MTDAYAEQSKCIYCLKWKPISEFNREHVIPQMMGTYDGNGYVLNRNEVCKECNDFFSKHLENSISLDSLEGLFRTQNAATPMNDGHRLGQNRLIITGQEGIFKGLKFQAVSDAKFSERIHLDIVPAVGIIHDEEKEEYDYYTIDGLCHCSDEMRGKLLLSKRPFVFFGYEEESVYSALKAKGFAMERVKLALQESVRDITSMQELSVQINAKIDTILNRLAAKTIFNFMRYTYDKEYILGHQFDHFRNFVRYGRTERELPMCFNNGKLSGIPQHVDKCHTVGTAWAAIDGHIYLCGFVSWFGCITYTYAIQRWVTKVVNVLPPNRVTVFDNINRRTIAIPDAFCYIDWPGNEGKLNIPGMINLAGDIHA